MVVKVGFSTFPPAVKNRGIVGIVKGSKKRNCFIYVKASSGCLLLAYSGHRSIQFPNGIEHLRKLASGRKGSNVLHETRQLRNILRLRPSSERFSSVNAEFFVF